MILVAMFISIRASPSRINFVLVLGNISVNKDEEALLPGAHRTDARALTEMVGIADPRADLARRAPRRKNLAGAGLPASERGIH
jgi:hypothetical protein